MKASQVKLGDFIMGFGYVADRREYQNDVIVFFTSAGRQLSRWPGEEVDTAEDRLNATRRMVREKLFGRNPL